MESTSSRRCVDALCPEVRQNPVLKTGTENKIAPAALTSSSTYYHGATRCPKCSAEPIGKCLMRHFGHVPSVALAGLTVL